MATTREPIYEALFTLLQTMQPTAIEINEFSRRFQHWSKVDLNLMPALFMQQYEEKSDQDGNMGLTRWHATVNVWIYFNATNPNALPDETYNNVLDALETVMKPSPVTGRQTLGGLVTHAWIEGPVPYSDGALDRKAVICAQIRLLWNGL